mmetsp:Transcript_15220/g.28641  ORF Transcript_15220/g.28641 Transcript_15220/m.28641 type:complete len:515 (-) Transcript_15220:77-1621(-)
MMHSPKQIALAILPKVSSVLSIFGSTFILLECFYFDRKRLERVYNRLLCSMAILDIMESVWNFASTWPIPKQSNPSIAFAGGNDTICNVQGFFLQLGLMIPVLNACLSLYYLLVIRHSWSEERIRRLIEPWFYAVSVIIGLGTSVAGIFLNLYHSSNLWCWIAKPPDHVDVKNNNYQFYRYAFYFIPLFCCFIVILVNMGMLIYTVKRLESASKKYLASSYSKRRTSMRSEKSESFLRPIRNGLRGCNYSKVDELDEFPSTGTIPKTRLESSSLTKLQDDVNAKEASIMNETNLSTRFCRETSMTEIDRILALKRSKKQSSLQIECGDEEQSPIFELTKSTSTTGITKHSITNVTFEDKINEKEEKVRYIRYLRTIVVSLTQSFFSKKENKRRSKSQQVIEQALFYVLSFILTFAWSFANRLFVLSGEETPFVIQLGNAFFDPLQGFINYCVYIRPKLIRVSKKYPNISFFNRIRSVITHRDVVVTDDDKEVEESAKKELLEWRNIRDTHAVST